MVRSTAVLQLPATPPALLENLAGMSDQGKGPGYERAAAKPACAGNFNRDRSHVSSAEIKIFFKIILFDKNL